MVQPETAALVLRPAVVRPPVCPSLRSSEQRGSAQEHESAHLTIRRSKADLALPRPASRLTEATREPYTHRSGIEAATVE